MRVGIYAPDTSPDDGGGHTYQRDIVDALAAIKAQSAHEFVLVSRAKDAPPGWGPDYLSLALGLGPKVVKRVQRSVKAAREGHPTSPRWRSDELFAAHGIDLVWGVIAGVPTRELPYVTTVLDLQHRRQPSFPEVSTGGEWDRRERLYSRELRAATIVIVGNATGQAEVERFYGILPERIRQLPHPTPRFALAASPGGDTDILRRHRLEPGYVFYPAQFWAHKNHVTLLEALAILRDHHGLGLTAVFAGSDKGNRGHVERVARSLRLQDKVRILGFVPQAHLIALYRQALALAYVSYFGPENLPPLEAFALGCPVVAADVAGASEQLGEAALLAKPSDARALAAALLSIHGDARLRTTLIERGRKRASEQTPGRFAEGMLAILDDLAPLVHTWR